jgi:hypothetical protein
MDQIYPEGIFIEPFLRESMGVTPARGEGGGEPDPLTSLGKGA